MTKPLPSKVIYRGPSMLDGTPIIVLAIDSDANRKTGGMLQTYILREDVEPLVALKSGDDASICGDCKHRPTNGGSCYVDVGKGPTVVWRTYHRGRYGEALTHDARTDMGRDRKVRLGTYGDPAAVPLTVWTSLLAESTGHTGYTHQWRDYPELAPYCMASADTSAERAAARLLGFRVFRVRTASQDREHGEAMCPASAEAGHKLQCADCMACSGASGRRGDITIIAHGLDHKVRKFEALVA